MDRLIATNSVPLANADTAPASGTPQYATSGNPGTSTPATIWPAYAFNAVQDEMMAVIAATGLTPNKANWAQVVQSIGRLAASKVTTISAAGTTTLTADNAGPVLVNATAGNVVLDLPAAAAASGIPIRFRFIRTDATANTVTVAINGADQFMAAAWGALTGPIGLVNGAPLDLVGDGLSHWLVNADPAAQRATQSVIVTGTYTAAHTGWHRITCQGGGGGASGGSGGSGGAGECRRGWEFLIAGQTVACTIGGGGAYAASGAAAGNGGLTSFGSYITAMGGGGGAAGGGVGGSGGSGGAEDYNGENGIDLDGTLYVARGGNAPLGFGYGGFVTGSTPGVGTNPSGYGAGGGCDSTLATGNNGGGGFILVEV